MGRAIVFPLVDKFSVALVRELFALWSVLVDGSCLQFDFFCHAVPIVISFH